MISQYIKERESEFEKKFCAGGVLKTSILVHEDGLETVNDFHRQSIVGLVEKIRAVLKDGAKQIGEDAPEGEWYLLPHGVKNVVGYISDETIGEIAYKGKPMNISAVIEETVVQGIKNLLSLEDLQDNGK